MTNTQPLNNKIIDINNMCEQITFLNLGPIPELEAVNRRSTDTDVEEIIADVTVTSLSEAQDDLLFALKHTPDPDSVSVALYEDEAADNHKIPRKRLKTFHEHPIPEPMDICISESSEKWMYSCCVGCVQTDGQTPLQYCRRAYPDRVIERYSDDSDEEREIDEYDPHRVFVRSLVEEDENEENEMEIWILEQEEKRRHPRRRRPEGLEEIALRLFEDEPEEIIMPVLEDELSVPPMPVLQRQNTQFTVNGITVYNGNPNGSRFFDDELL
jgi:hypothetical protein